MVIVLGQMVLQQIKLHNRQKNSEPEYQNEN